jgi:hypothetical protein
MQCVYIPVYVCVCLNTLSHWQTQNVGFFQSPFPLCCVYSKYPHHRYWEWGRVNTMHENILHCIVESSLMLWPTVSRQVCLGIKHPFGAYDQILITVRQLWVCWCEAFALTRGWVCCLQLLLALASAVILGSKSLGTRNHILLSEIRDFPFRCLLWLTGLWWRYSTLPPNGGSVIPVFPSLYCVLYIM